MSTTTRKNRQRRADAPGKKSHQERRQATIALNDLPNDAVRREVSREVKACQRCHHKYGRQFSVVLGENNQPS